MTPEVVGTGPALAALRRIVSQVGPTDATVLILGETGTGKELIARSLHAASPRREQPFVPVNCAALVPSLLISELFGHEAGAFTGAVRRRAGKFEQAHGGTVFLDEVGELATDAQAVLLRVLQERVVERVGGGEAVPVDVRVIAATNRDLASDVRAGRFRADLYYRLNVFPVAVPPLRERREDIPELVAHFIRHFATKHGKPAAQLRPETLRQLVAHDWPGNVRELQNLIERAVIMTGTCPDPQDRNAAERGRGGEEQVVFDPAWLVGASAIETARTWAEQERQRILDALRAAGGRVYGPGGAAHRLGLKPTTLYGKMRKHGIERG